MKKTLQLNTDWKFSKLPDGRDSRPVFEAVELPHTWYEEGNGYRGLCVYEKEVELPSGSKAAYVKFFGADQKAEVLVNGTPVGTHEGGYSAFAVPVPADAVSDGRFMLQVYLTNEKNNVISPLAGDFTIFGGLYRGVEVIVTDDARFDYSYFGTDGVWAYTSVSEKKGEVHVRTKTVNAANATVSLVLKDADGKCAASAIGNVNSEIVLTLENPVLWNGKNSVYQYELTTELIVNGECVDRICRKVGFKTLTMDAKEGAFLNGKHIRINGVSKHQDTDQKYYAESQEDREQDFELIREIGANAVRLSHYQHIDETYTLADEAGLLVWAEIPLLKMNQDLAMQENARLQLKELILQTMHHISIFCWGIQNEIGMFGDYPYMTEVIRQMKDEAKELDPSRLVTAANLYGVKAKSGLNHSTDMIGYNCYFGWYYGEMHDYSDFLDKLHENLPEMPLGMSEYGVDSNIKLHTDTPMIRDYSEEYQAVWHETVYNIFKQKSYLWGSFVWNMFDFSSDMRKEGGQLNRNAKGLVTYDRKTRKDAFYYYKAQWSEESFVHICSKRFERRATDDITVRIYTNQPAVTLFVNDERFAEGNNDGNGTVVFEHVPMNMENGAEAEVKVKAVAGPCQDDAIFMHVAEAEESYKLPDSGAGQAVKNWFLTGNELSKEGYFSIEDIACELLENEEARKVLAEEMPVVFKLMTERDVIPLGLSLKSILSRDESGLDVKKINDRLNLIKAE